MKKLFWIFIIIAASIAGLAYWDKDFRLLLMQTAGQAPVRSIVYKWQDSSGNWQISNTPPAKGTPYTEQEYLSNTNVVPALPKKE